MGLFRSYAKFKIAKKAFNAARRWWRRRKSSRAKTRVR